MKLPLSIVWEDDGDEKNYNDPEEGRIVDRIVDADGVTIIETDSGYYPPYERDAVRIVNAVNIEFQEL